MASEAAGRREPLGFTSTHARRAARANTLSDDAARKRRGARWGAGAPSPAAARPSTSVIMSLTDVQLDEFRAAFDLVDRDGSGVISADELRALLRTLGHEPSAAYIERLMSTADLNGDGGIDFCEFATLMAHRIASEDPERTLRNAFAVLWLPRVEPPGRARGPRDCAPTPRAARALSLTPPPPASLSRALGQRHRRRRHDLRA